MWQEPLALPFPTTQSILACGAESKNTVCVVKNGMAFLSRNFGDLADIENLQAFQHGMADAQAMCGLTPTMIAYDLHPEYLSTKYARTLLRKVPLLRSVGVQHHHAHIVACMADNEIRQTAIGVAFDGLGYGIDGHFWGGEFLIVDYAGFQRVGHLQYIPMPGGIAAIKEPWRMALAYLDHIYGDQLPHLGIEFMRHIDRRQQAIVIAMIHHKVNALLTSSIGRLFDAVSALLGICQYAHAEGQAAIALQAMAEQFLRPAIPSEIAILPYDYDILEQSEPPYYLIQPASMFVQIVEEVKKNMSIPIIAARFHITIADMILNLCDRLSKRFHLHLVALAGGVFQNQLLREQTVQQLQQRGFEVVLPRRVPFHDGNISFGQAIVAAATLCA